MNIVDTNRIEYDAMLCPLSGEIRINSSATEHFVIHRVMMYSSSLEYVAWYCQSLLGHMNLRLAERPFGAG